MKAVKHGFGELFEEPVFAENVFGLLVVFQQLIERASLGAVRSQHNHNAA